MPLGWYLAQGLYPLGPSSSDDEEGPCELPDGRIVCGPHGFVVCGKCCTDYSFMDSSSDEDGFYGGGDDDDDDDDNDDEDDIPINDNEDSDLDLPGSFGTEKRRGTGQVFPMRFIPPMTTIMPTELFPAQRIYPQVYRYINRNDPQAVLIFTDGACLDNGQPNPKAGWAIVHGQKPTGVPLTISGRLESKGPFGDEGIQSSNRAELRAVITALRLRHWPGEGFSTMVIATDSEYVVKGSTKWARSWTRNDWKTNTGADVKNKDMWEMLLGEFERWNEEGLSIKFWRIPRDWNTTADEAAKKRASEDKVPSQWVEVLGLPF
ncbi:ribonuclease H-like protein [Daldinia vernicosa]|uniref:ribonuclease H-like protein n=1 Tax=Daldinia vernicosa TaxID=114800 RepID=UPI0020088BE2|nr:ribonuclease H-like protein [Daldinia vernicosa]KAI0846355.1 ribonuclease H-like protein [Daldinia vernicosa]